MTAPHRTRLGAPLFFVGALALSLVGLSAGHAANAMVATALDTATHGSTPYMHESELVSSADTRPQRTAAAIDGPDSSTFAVSVRGDRTQGATPASPPLVLDEPTALPTPTPPPTATPAPTATPTSTPTPAPTATPIPVPTAAAPSNGVTERGLAALSTVGFDPASLGYTLSFHPYTGTHRGLTFTKRLHIDVYIRPTMSDSEIRYIIAHELGHAVDHIRNTGEGRARWRAARGMAPELSWWPNHTASDYASPSGDFAECFASWKVGSASHSSWGSCAPMMGLMAELAAG